MIELEAIRVKVQELNEELEIKPHDIVVISDEVGYVYTEAIDEDIHFEVILNNDEGYHIAKTTSNFEIRWNKFDLIVTSPLSKVSDVEYTLHRIYRYNKENDAFERVWSSTNSKKENIYGI